MFQYFPDGASVRPSLKGLEVEMRPAPALQQAKVDISVNIDGTGHVMFDYMAELFEQATIDSIGQSLARMLEGAAKASEQVVWRIPILGGSNRQQS